MTTHTEPHCIEITSTADQADSPCKVFYVTPPDLSAPGLPRLYEPYHNVPPGRDTILASEWAVYGWAVPRSEWTVTLSDDGQSARVVVPYR